MGAGVGWRAATAASALLVVLAVAWLGLRTGVLRFRTFPAAEALEVKAGLWCDKDEEAQLPQLWNPDVGGPSVQVRVVTYNLFWGILFDTRGGMNGSAGKLLAEHCEVEPYDLLGFQECHDVDRVLRDAQLKEQFDSIQGGNGLCLAYRKADWTVLASGQEEIGEDQPGNYWGKRSVQWMRIQSRDFGKVVFFMNHHGPLQIDSGGICGGEATAFHLVRSATAQAQNGDAIILVGDFNARIGSKTIDELSARLARLFTGDKFGGIDHFFSNVAAPVRTENLGGGGSDHDALATVVQIGDGAPVNLQPKETTTTTTVTTASLTDTTTTQTTTTKTDTSDTTTTTTVTTLTTTITATSATTTMGKDHAMSEIAVMGA